MNKLSAYARLLRLPGIGALGIVPVIAALTMGIYDLYDLTIIFIIGAFACIFGFLINDYADVELDKLVDELSKKPLVSGVIPKRAGLMISILLTLGTFFFMALLWFDKPIDSYKFIGLICIIAAGILGSIYDLYGKKIVGSDFLVAISVSLVFLFGALSYGKPNVITWIIFILTFENILYMNAIQNGIKDADHDYKMGVTNIALTSGVTVKSNNITIPFSFKAFGFGMRLFSAVLFFVPFFVFNYDYYMWQIVLLTTLIVVFLALDAKFLSLKVFDRGKIRKIIGVQSFLRYSLVPIMLISIIGTIPSLILIILPMIWYVLFTPLLGEELFKPRM